MHFKTNEIFGGTFKRETLQKVLKHAKLTDDQIKALSLLITDAPDTDGEVAIMHVIQTLANEIVHPKYLDTRVPFKVIQEDGKIVMLGLVGEDTDAYHHDGIMLEHGLSPTKHVLIIISRAEFNKYRDDSDFPGFIKYGL